MLCLYQAVKTVVKFCVDILMEHDCIDKTFLYTLLEFYFRWHIYNCVCEDKPLEIEYIHVMKPLKILELRNEIKPFSKVHFVSLTYCISDAKFMMFCHDGFVVMMISLLAVVCV